MEEILQNLRHTAAIFATCKIDCSSLLGKYSYTENSAWIISAAITATVTTATNADITATATNGATVTIETIESTVTV